MERNLNLAIMGFGHRGQLLTREAVIPACHDMGAQIVAVYDSYSDRTVEGADIVEAGMGKRPVEVSSEDEIFNNPDIDAVIITTAWEAHVDLAIKAMRAGKYVAIEVGGAYTIEECWKLVHTSEETGVPCMMLENCCFGERELMILNMKRLGVMGDIVHCSGGYHHDLRQEIANGIENRHYRLRNYLNRNCENYPTHELGPIAKLLDINNGNRLLSLTSTASCAKGLHEYVVSEKGQAHPLAKAEFAQGDIVTTVIKCAKGQTIVLTLDTTLPRAYSRGFTIRGTKASYFEDMDCVYEDGKHNEFHLEPKKIWGNAEEYKEEYQHPLWRNYDPKGGHGGMDYLVISAFLEAAKKGVHPPIDVYDAATYMCITALSEESIIKGGAPIAIPDFTRGKWCMRQDIDYSLTFNLDRKQDY